MFALPFTMPPPTSRVTRSLITLSIAAAIVLFALGSLIAITDFQNLSSRNTFVDRATTAQLAAERLLSRLKDAETGQRGYLLTGDLSYLQPYESARWFVDADFTNLETTPLASTSQATRLERIRMLTDTKLAELAKTIELFQTGQRDAALQVVLTNEGQRTMDALRAQIADLQMDTQEWLSLKQSAVNSASGWIKVMGLFAVATTFLSTAIVAKRRIQRDIDAKLYKLDRFMRAFGQTQGTLRSLDGKIIFWGVGAERLYGYSAAEALGRSAPALLHSKFPIPFEEINAILLRDGEWQGELTRRHKDGREIHIISKWTLSRGEAGEPDVAIEVSTDITSIKHTEHNLQQINSLLRAILENAPGLIYAKDLDGRIILANALTLDLIGKPWAEIEGRTDLEFLDNEAQAKFIMANDRRIMGEAKTEEFEEIVSRDSNQPRIWSSTKAPLYNDDGSVIGLVGVSVEITERKRIENRLQLMVNELNHRVKNTLATVQAIASQTLRGSDPIIRQNLERRLLALAAAHDVLTHEKWEGASIDDVVSGALAPFGDNSDNRFTVSGPPLRLQPRAALALAMGLHELTTNALKYGALSGHDGHVTIDWRIVEYSRDCA